MHYLYNVQVYRKHRLHEKEVYLGLAGLPVYQFRFHIKKVYFITRSS